MAHGWHDLSMPEDIICLGKFFIKVLFGYFQYILDMIEKIKKKFNLFGIQTHPISLSLYELRANRISPNWDVGGGHGGG